MVEEKEEEELTVEEAMKLYREFAKDLTKSIIKKGACPANQIELI